MPLLAFEGLPIWLNLALFAATSAGVWLAGTRLCHYADAIADRKRIGKAMMGFVFLAAATELPEVVTTIVGSMAGEARLVLNNMFGGITMQTAILAVADAAVPMVTLTSYPRNSTPALEGILLILLLALLLAVSALGDAVLFWNVGIGSVIFAFSYAGTIALLRNFDQEEPWLPVEVLEEAAVPLAETTARNLDAIPMSRLAWMSLAATLVILVCGVMLVNLAKTLAVQTGWGTSFIGVTLLAASTSLPELSTTIAAVRLGAFTMAISNIFGSNLIMIALLLPADIFYTQGVLLDQIDATATFALISGLIVSSVYVAGLLLRNRKRVLGMGIDSVIVLVIYSASLVVFFFLT